MSKKSLLVVDDSATFRQLLCMSLTRVDGITQANITEATDGQDALEKLQTGSFDLALTDILQILSLSRKTGVVLLNGAGLEEGKIIVESGRITHASARPGKSLSDSLMAAGVLRPEILKALTPRGESIDSQLEKLLHRGG